MIIHIFNQQNVLPVSSQQVKKLVAEAISFEGVRCDEVSIYFVTTEEICDLHKIYFNDPTETDCISFPLDEEDDDEYRILGDVFVCPATAKKYANENSAEPYEELTLYIVHGLLHLMGYDDIEETDIEQMRAREKLHMNNLKIKQLMIRKEDVCS